MDVHFPAALSLLLVAASLAPAARGQETPPDPGMLVLDPLVVEGNQAITATKTNTALIETPQSVSIVPREEIAERGVQRFEETLRYSAGASAEPWGVDTRYDQPIVRGFNAALYLDGMLTRGPTYTVTPRVEPFTLERVEVLRGPSSMLYGQGTTGGVLNGFSKRPQFDRAGEVGVQYGTYDRRQLQFDLTGPLNEAATVAGRVVGVFRRSDMQTDFVDDNRYLLAPSLTWEGNAGTTVTFLGLLQRDDTAGSQEFLPYVATLGNDFPRLPNSTFIGEPDWEDLDTRQASGTLVINQKFDDFEVNANLRYADISSNFRDIYPDVFSNPTNPWIDADNRVLNRYAFHDRSEIRMLTGDVNAAGRVATGPVSHLFLAGVDYFRYKENTSSGTALITPIDVYDPDFGQPFTPPELSALPEVRQSQIGVYLQDQMRWRDLTVVAGVRRDRAEVEGDNAQTDQETTLRVGAIYEHPGGIAPYASYTESFQPVLGQDNDGNVFVPQRGKQVEVGVKWQPRDDTLVTLSAYRLTETNRPVNDPEDVLNVIQTGEIEGRGVELEASLIMPRDLTLTFAASYARTEVIESSFDYEEGRQLGDTPKKLASIWGAKTFSLPGDWDLRVGGGVRYVGATEAIGPGETLRSPGRTLVDALLAVDRDAWSFQLTANNLFDKQYVGPCRLLGDCFTGSGRNIVGTLSYRF